MFELSSAGFTSKGDAVREAKSKRHRRLDCVLKRSWTRSDQVIHHHCQRGQSVDGVVVVVVADGERSLVDWVQEYRILSATCDGHHGQGVWMSIGA